MSSLPKSPRSATPRLVIMLALTLGRLRPNAIRAAKVDLDATLEQKARGVVRWFHEESRCGRESASIPFCLA